ncbi:uncharacterized protein [Halyomorpha halys]|uniref:uncharacterized protein isoform X1 n=1 Tax=Halyomorpha halys TaxID=286706 RepID=UPI0006D51179|nr:uncharacterized protein LOC106684977 isoform X1 [Halyomorpha halys]
MAKLFKWTERAERKFNKTIKGIRPSCLLHHFIVLAVWERFNQYMHPEYLSIAEVRAKLESVCREYNLETKMDDMFREEEFSLSPEEFPECQDVNRNESNFGNLEDNNVSNAEAGPSRVSNRQMNKRKKGILGKIRHVTPTKASKKNRK